MGLTSFGNSSNRPHSGVTSDLARAPAWWHPLLKCSMLSSSSQVRPRKAYMGEYHGLLAVRRRDTRVASASFRNTSKTQVSCHRRY